MKILSFISVMLLSSFTDGTIYCTSNSNSTGNIANISFCVPDSGPPPALPTCAILLNAPPVVKAQLMCGTSPMSNPFGNGMFCMNPLQPLFRVGPIITTALNGSGVQSINWGALPNPMFQPLYFQWVFRDPTAVGFTYNTSNAIMYTVMP
jgi:hypothetical protein